MILIRKTPTKPKIKTNSEQLEIWDKIQAEQLKETVKKNKLRLALQEKNKQAEDNLSNYLENIYTRINDLEKSKPRNFDYRNEYLNRKSQKIQLEIDCLSMGLKLLKKIKESNLNISLCSQEISNSLILFFKNKGLNKNRIGYLNKIVEVATDFRKENIQLFENIKLIIKLTNNIILLRKALAGNIKTKKLVPAFDAKVIEAIENPVPF
ncbi:MAG: hypothetical protein WCX82_00530 [archaeon]